MRVTSSALSKKTTQTVLNYRSLHVVRVNNALSGGGWRVEFRFSFKQRNDKQTNTNGVILDVVVVNNVIYRERLAGEFASAVSANSNKTTQTNNYELCEF